MKSLIVISIFLLIYTSLFSQKIYFGDSSNDKIYIIENSYCEISDSIEIDDLDVFAVKKNNQHIYVGSQVDVFTPGVGAQRQMTIKHYNELGIYIEDVIQVVVNPMMFNMAFIDEGTIILTAALGYVLVDIVAGSYQQHTISNENYLPRDIISFNGVNYIGQYLSYHDIRILDLTTHTVSPIPDWSPLYVQGQRGRSRSFDIIGNCAGDFIFINLYKLDLKDAFLSFHQPPDFEIIHDCYFEFLRGFTSEDLDVIQYPLILDFDRSNDYCTNNDTSRTVLLCEGEDMIQSDILWWSVDPYIEEYQDHIDSMTINILGGPSSIILKLDNDEILSQRNSNHSITVYNDGTTTLADFRQAILDTELSLLDDSDNFLIEIEYQLYSYIRKSSAASLYVHIIQENVTAGRDSSIFYCPTDALQDLSDYLSPEAQMGQWLQGPMYDPQNDSAGDFLYVSSAIHCKPDTAIISVQLHPDAIVDRQMYNLCPGDSILYAGRYYTEETMLSDTIYAVESGCDSVYTEVEISILSQATVVQIDTSLCYGDQLEIDNQMYDSEGSYIHTLSSQQSGCDSIAYEINLEIIPEASRIMIDTILCTGESITIGSLTIDRDTVSEIIIKDLSQCDSIIYVLDVQIAEVKNVVIDTILCNGQSIEIEGILYDSATQDQIIISDQQGCDSIIYDLNILIEETVMIMDQQYEIEANVPTVVSIEVLSNDDNIIWQPSIGLSCDDCLSPKVTLDMDQEYVVTLMSEEGCSQEIIVNVLVNQVTTDKSDYYVANIIDLSSNDNDVLYVQSSESMMTYSMTIFDRWGSVVYDRKDILVNDKSQGWNGMYNNQAELSQGIYVYKIEMEDGDVLVGDVMHVR